MRETIPEQYQSFPSKWKTLVITNYGYEDKMVLTLKIFPRKAVNKIQFPLNTDGNLLKKMIKNCRIVYCVNFPCASDINIQNFPWF